MNRSVAVVALLSFSAVAAAIACGEDTAPINDGSSGGSSSGRSSTSSSGNASSSGTGSSGTGSSGGSSGTSSSGGTNDGGKDASSDGGPATSHVVISEVGVAPAGGEFVEIWNPTSQAVDLSQYYLSDNALYHGIAADAAFAPPIATSGTDFLAKFPNGTMLAAGATLVVATDAVSFYAKWTKCPDLVLKVADVACTVGTAKAMVVPTNGAIGANVGFSNDREMLVIFKWDGAAATVKDVDYVTWGGQFDSETRIDKTGVAGYVADTKADAQSPAPAPGNFLSIERCSKSEQGEKKTGGNGIDGHDETSEPFGSNFVIQLTPTPGVKNTCL
jgi:hypothetical protein